MLQVNDQQDHLRYHLDLYPVPSSRLVDSDIFLALSMILACHTIALHSTIPVPALTWVLKVCTKTWSQATHHLLRYISLFLAALSLAFPLRHSLSLRLCDCVPHFLTEADVDSFICPGFLAVLRREKGPPLYTVQKLALVTACVEACVRAWFSAAFSLSFFSSSSTPSMASKPAKVCLILSSCES